MRGLSRASTPRSAHDPSSCVSGARTQVMCPQIRVYAECGGGDEGKDDGNGGKFIPEGSIRDYKLGATVYVKSDAGEWIDGTFWYKLKPPPAEDSADAAAVGFRVFGCFSEQAWSRSASKWSGPMCVHMRGHDASQSDARGKRGAWHGALHSVRPPTLAP